MYTLLLSYAIYLNHADVELITLLRFPVASHMCKIEFSYTCSSEQKPLVASPQQRVTRRFPFSFSLAVFLWLCGRHSATHEMLSCPPNKPLPRLPRKELHPETIHRSQHQTPREPYGVAVIRAVKTEVT